MAFWQIRLSHLQKKIFYITFFRQISFLCPHRKNYGAIVSELADTIV